MDDVLSKQDEALITLVGERPGRAAWDLADGLKRRGWKGSYQLTMRRLRRLAQLNYLIRERGERYNDVTYGARPFRYYLDIHGQEHLARRLAQRAGAR